MRSPFFDPRALDRVVEAVEWEDDLVVYNDGSTNQARWMHALGTMMERWSAQNVQDAIEGFSTLWFGDYDDIVARAVTSISLRVQQMLGFWSAIFGRRARTFDPVPWPPLPELPGPPPAGGRTVAAVEMMAQQILQWARGIEEER